MIGRDSADIQIEKEDGEMTAISPVSKSDAGEDLKKIYAGLEEKFKFIPQFFGVMGHRPGVLANVLALNGSVMGEGSVDAKYKELAYLKTSRINACHY